MVIKLNRTYLIFGAVVLAMIIFFVTRKDPNTILVTVHTSAEKTSVTDISIEYPQFSHVSKTFNKHVVDTVNQAVLDFKQSVQDNEAVRNTPAGKGMPVYQYLLRVSWMPSVLNTHTISFVLHTSYFTGGAHGGKNIYTFNYDEDKNTEITLDSLFGNVPSYLSRVSGYAINDLKDQLRSAQGGTKPDETMITDGAAPTIENFSHFTVGQDDTVTFYFSLYQVAPYVAGEQEVVMPLSFILATSTLTQ